MVGQAGSPTYIVYADMTLSQSKVKVISRIHCVLSKRGLRPQACDCDCR